MKMKVPNKNYGITELYDIIATSMGIDINKIKYDCRYITVANNIQDGFIKYYRNENPDASECDFNSDVYMLLLSYGPKVDKTLKDNEIEVFDGFIKEV